MAVFAADLIRAPAVVRGAEASKDPDRTALDFRPIVLDDFVARSVPDVLARELPFEQMIRCETGTQATIPLGSKFDQDVDVAIRPCLVTGIGAVEAESRHTPVTQGVFDGPDSVDDLSAIHQNNLSPSDRNVI